jgi:spore maturation protein CgeB
MASGCEIRFLNSEEAFEGFPLLRKWNWWVRGRRPGRLREFSATLLEACWDFKPEFLLSTGIAPISREGLKSIGSLGIQRLNFLTDDPWNPQHRAPWFMDALPHYDQVFSPRRANLDDLRRLGCLKVSYLPFGYSPQIHFPEPPMGEAEIQRFDSDVVFAGGADPDRVSCIAALIRDGQRVALYGGYWDRHSITGKYARGHADAGTLRKAIGGAKVALCLVRRANRDGHSMRTFELAATGACMLTEDTAEHREIFGKDGDAVIYFRALPEMLEKLRWLLDHSRERVRLAENARQRILSGGNTYQGRVSAMLGLAPLSAEPMPSFMTAPL